MTSKKDRDKIPAGWEWKSGGRRCGYYRREGHAMNGCQWLRPVIWTVSANEEKQSADVRCNWAYYVNNDGKYSHVSSTLTIVGDSLKVEEGPWEIKPRRGESPILAGIRWVEQQENAAEKLGSK